MTDAQRVLVVDSESETEEVLRAVLEPRGLRVDRVRELTGSPAPTPPSLLIIDDDKPPAEIRGEQGWAGVPRVVIGSARLADQPAGRGGQYLQKPFQYPELIRLIDQLLSEDSVPRNAA